MSGFYKDAIVRDGFIFRKNEFLADPELIKLTEPENLQSWFLPELSLDGKFIIDIYGDDDSFVRSQLKHYGVEFDETEISGDGSHLMQKVLRDGKCDKVPDHIIQLREEMQKDWVKIASVKDLAHFPALFLDKYLLTSGQPDRAKTPDGLTVPFERFNRKEASLLFEAAGNVKGLHREKVQSAKSLVLFLGWDAEDVHTKASEQIAKDKEQIEAEGKKLKLAAEKSKPARDAKHKKYLDNLTAQGDTGRPSLVGSYIIECPEIEEQWPDNSRNMTLNIRQTNNPSVLEGCFDFGVLRGIMMISTDMKVLEKHCAEMGRETESDWEEDDYTRYYSGDGRDKENDNRNSNIQVTTGSKRRSNASQMEGRPSKKPKTNDAQPRRYNLKLRCRETGENECYPEGDRGSLKFADNFASFSAKADLPCVGGKQPFSGRKVSDKPAGRKYTWLSFGDYSRYY